uniref:Uncharacterized protein n=1 Tax=Timema poppense TaxID=170557 RepID=A0A7R9H3H3_TIMPO|nr:unnamed protein product [Timema poppensis]
MYRWFRLNANPTQADTLIPMYKEAIMCSPYCESNTLDRESGDGACQHIGCRYGDSYGIGKTTLIKTVSKLLIDKKVTIAGFYTEEIRNAGKRIGFDVVTLDGKRGILARVILS